MTSDQLKTLLSACSAVQSEIDRAGCGAVSEESSAITLYDRLITHSLIRKTTRDLFNDGYYALAVEQCFKCVNNEVKSRSGSDQDGAALMQHALSLAAPRIKLNPLETKSERDEQLGYMQILSGCMIGVRNPRAHEHDYLDEPVRALELIALGQHLLQKVDAAACAPLQPLSRK